MTTVVAIDIDGEPHEVSLGDVEWRPSVYGIVIRDGKILLSPQHGDNRYDLPGGGVEMDESFDAALVREVREETGVDVTPGKLLALRDNYFKVTFRKPEEVWHSVMVYYACEMIGGEISTDGLADTELTYAKQAEWVAIDRLDSIGLAASYDWREIVREAARN